MHKGLFCHSCKNKKSLLASFGVVVVVVVVGVVVY